MHAHHHGGCDPSGRSGRRLLATLGVTASIALAETIGGSLSGSLSLLADAGHMLTDLLALLVAYTALRLAARPADDRRTYGYRRFEVLAALLNGLALIVMSVAIVVEAAQRLLAPEPVAVGTMMGVAAIGLLANLVGLALLHRGRDNVSVHSAFLHVLGDTLSSLGVLCGGGIIYLTGWTRIDALLSVGIAAIIVFTSLRMLREVIDVLLEAAPRGLDTAAIRSAILALPKVAQLHDLHVWSITQGVPALSAHVAMACATDDPQDLLCQIQQMLRKRFAVNHVTLQIERLPRDAGGGLTQP